jgi:hypothetical protein
MKILYIHAYLYVSIMREQTFNGQVLVLYVIKHEQFETDINLPTKRKIFCLYHFYVKGDVTTPIHFFVSFWIERQPPTKEDRQLEANIYILIE